MSLELDRPSPLIRVGLPVAFALGCAHLVSEAAELGLPHPFESGLFVLGLTLVGMVLLALAALRARETSPDRAARRWREMALFPCVMAPLAVLSPWTIAPSHLGLGFPGASFFVSWLTRYPTLGPINVEVALGIGALLGACAMPAFFALYAVQARAMRPRVVGTFVGLQLLAYLPVLYRLDAELFLVPAMLFPGPLALACAAGAITRMVATLAMFACLVAAVRRPAPAVVWEMQ